jgi:hypothetical protein
LKREHERFHLFVPIHYCVPAQTFLFVSDRLPLLIIWMNVPWAFIDQKRSYNVRTHSETLKVQGRLMVWNVHTEQDKRFETFEKSHLRFKNEIIAEFFSRSFLVMFFPQIDIPICLLLICSTINLSAKKLDKPRLAPKVIFLRKSQVKSWLDFSRRRTWQLVLNV